MNTDKTYITIARLLPGSRDVAAARTIVVDTPLAPFVDALDTLAANNTLPALFGETVAVDITTDGRTGATAAALTGGTFIVKITSQSPR